MLMSCARYRYLCVSIWHKIIDDGLVVNCKLQISLYWWFGANIFGLWVGNSISISSLWWYDQKYLIKKFIRGWPHCGMDATPFWKQIALCVMFTVLYNSEFGVHVTYECWEAVMNLKTGFEFENCLGGRGFKSYQNRSTDIHENL